MMLPEIPKDIPRQTSNKRRLWVTADEHYYHTNIIEYCKRPFSDAGDMNRQLIDNHNMMVRENDVVIHIGDFCMSRRVEDFFIILPQLHGTHFLMDGSHDQVLQEVVPAAAAGLFTMLPKLFEFTYNGETVVLCHYAMAKWKRSHHGSVHLFGHSHGNYAHPGRAVDVGVDSQHYFPVRIEEAIAEAKAKPQETYKPRI